MKKTYSFCKRQKILFSILTGIFLFLLFPAQAQQLIDSLKWAPDYSFTSLATGQNSLFIGGMRYIGKAHGHQAFFLNGSTQPQEGMPYFTGYYNYNPADIFTIIKDGNKGWYAGGNFIYANGEKTGPVVHILPDKRLEIPFIKDISFPVSDFQGVHVLKKEGDFLYVGGTFKATDNSGNKYLSLFRVNLSTGMVDHSFHPLKTNNPSMNFRVDGIEISDDKVFVSGTLYHNEVARSFMVFDKATGDFIPAIDGIRNIILMGDTLLCSGKDMGTPVPYEVNTFVLDSSSDADIKKTLKGFLVYSLPDGKGGWYVAGTIKGDKGFYHLDKDLKVDSTFVQHNNPYDGWGGSAVSQMLLSGHSLYLAVANRTYQVEGKNISQVFKLNATTGAIDTVFSPNPDELVFSIAVKGDTLFLSGLFNNIAGQKQPGLAAVRCSTGKLVDWHPEISGCGFYWDGIYRIHIYGKYLYAAGRFSLPGTSNIRSLARFNTETLQADTTFHVKAFINACPKITGMALYGDKLFVNGDFSLVSQGKQIIHLGYVDLNNRNVYPVNEAYRVVDYSSFPKMEEYGGKIYCWGQSVTDSSNYFTRRYFFGFNANSGQLMTWNPNPDNLQTFSESGGQRLLSGMYHISRLNGFYINNEKAGLIGLNTHTLQFIPVYAPGHKAPPEADPDFVLSDKYIFFGNKSKGYGDSITNGLVRLRRKGLTYFPWHDKPDFGTNFFPFKKLATGSNGLYVLGPFKRVNGIERPGICLLTPDSGKLLSWRPALPDQNIDDLFVLGKNVVLRSNYSRFWPAWERNPLAKIDLQTGKLALWNPDINLHYNSVYNMEAHGDTLMVLFNGNVDVDAQDTGFFLLINSQTGQHIPGFKPPKRNNTNYYDPNRKRLFARSGPSVFIIGGFTEVNGEPHNNLVKINAKTGKVEPWAPPVTAQYGFTSIGVYKDTVYISGNNILLNGEKKRYSLVSIDAKSGKVIHKYSYIINGFPEPLSNLAITPSGTIIAIPYYTNRPVCLLRPGARDTLVRTTKLLNTGESFNAIKTFGNNMVFSVNRIKEKGKATNKPGFLWYNPKQDTVFKSFSLPIAKGNKVSSIAFFNNMMMVSGDMEGIYGHYDIKNLAFLKMSGIRLKPGISSWTPHKADNRNPFAVNIYGYGFNDSTAVELYSGDTVVRPDSVTYNNYKMVAWFDGTRFSVGDWNLKVKISDTMTRDFPKAIRLYQGTYADMWAKWVGPKVVLVHKPETYYVTYGNKGNSDAFGVFLYIAVGEHQKVIFPESVRAPEIKYHNFSLDADTMSRYIQVDDFFGKPFHGKVYTLFIPYVPAHTENAIKLFIQSDVHGETPEMRLVISPPLYDSYSQMMDNLKSTGGSFVKCLYDIVGSALQLSPAGGCVKSVVDNFIVEKFKLAKTGKSGGWWFWAKQSAVIILDCAGISEIKSVITMAKDVTLMLVNGHGAFGDCSNFYNSLHGNNTNSSIQSSVDPNDKFGPTGMHSSHFVRSDIPYHYLITFENDSNATAPAERVVIKDTLDQSVFDLNTFKALGFGFGDTTYLYRDQDKDTVYIDLRPAKNTIVRVFYHLDKSSGVLTWTFQSLDPSTYEYVSDPSDGFLPPNKKAPEGDGNVLYSIHPLSGLSQGTIISNTAHIVFDWNDEMATKAWTNKTDNTAPESAVKSLPSYETDKDFTVSWGGSDEGSGIYSYTVYVSENDSAYYPWLIDTHDTSAVFSGTFGSTYKFYTVATDSAGNVEAVPGIYDAMTRLSGTGIETFGKGNKMQFRLYPNPATDRLNLDCYLPQSSEVRIDLMNVCGHLVKEPIKLNGTRGIHTNSMDISTLPAGTYFVRILTKYGSQIRKVIVR